MSAVTLTKKQRDVLRVRLERAILWREATAYARSEATRLANIVIAEIEDTGATASLQRRAVENVVTAIAEVASLRSVSPAEREAPPAASAAELGSEAAS